MNIDTAIAYAVAELEKAGVPEPRRDAKTMLAVLLGRDAAFLIAHPEYMLTRDEESRISEAVARRATREPLQYILGRQEFYGLEFIVTPDVLIPRPETEAVVETAISLLEKYPEPRFCEVGAGSGCISVAILKNVPNAEALALEISTSAIAVACKNAERHDVSSRLELVLSDVFSAVDGDKKFDAIVSNPPYVDSREMSTLQSEVRDFEPRAALTDGGDGLGIIRRIVDGSPGLLRPGGALLIEIGFRQSETVAEMFHLDLWSDVRFLPDLSGIPRVVLAFSGSL